jgi:hypothetical protein
MVALLAEIRDRAKDENEYQGDFKVRGLRERLAALPPDAPLRERWEILAHLGEGEVLLGRERAGVALLEEAFALLPRAREELPPEWPMELTFRLGTAWMRIAETENCCASDSPDACLLPIRGGGIHSKPEGARRALDRFLEVLEGTPAESPLHLKARWLAAVAAQTLGGHPDAIPPAHRLPPGTFESSSAFPRFPNVAARAGLATFSLSGGAAVEDYDGDGDLDLLVSTAETSRNLRYWRNGGDGTFSDRTAEAHLEGLLGGLNLVHGDVDNDGDLDVVVLRGAWFGKAGRHPNSLLRNRGNGVFDDVCGPAGLDPPPGGTHSETAFRGKRAARSSRAGATLDFDGDGRLDIVVNNFNDRAWLWRNVSPERPWCGIRLKETRGRRDAVGSVVRLTAGGGTQVRMVQSSSGYLGQSSSTLHFGLGDAKAVEKVEVRWPGGNLQTVTDVKAGVVNTITEPPE